MPSSHSWKQPVAGYLTGEAANYLRVSKRTLIRWRNRRIGPAWTNAGHKVIYRQRDLDIWLDANTVTPVDEGQA